MSFKMYRSHLYSIKILVILAAAGAFFVASHVDAQYGYGGCSEYGLMAYEDYSGYCKCMSGYVFQDTLMGKQCVSADSVCRDEYGVMSSYNSLYDRCECSYGYVLGKDSIGRTQCISDDQACKNQLGYNSRATYGGNCECSYGYFIEGGECVNGDRSCRSDHGLYASFNNSASRCECDDGYVFDDDNQCVKKHNSAYFTLLDINDDDELLVQSQYDFSKYIISYGIGCWDHVVEQYLGTSLVINMGTDFSVDMFDDLVLHNHDQNCSIMSVSRTYEDSFPEEEEYSDFYYTPPPSTFTAPNPVTVSYQTPPDINDTDQVEEEDENPIEVNEDALVFDWSSVNTEASTTENIEKEDTVEESPKEEKVSFFRKVINFFKSWF